MDTKEEADKKPTAYDGIDAYIKAAQQRVREIDNQIAYIKEQSPQPVPRPSWDNRPQVSVDKAKQLAKWEEQKAALKVDTRVKVMEALVNTDPQMKKVLDRLDFQFDEKNVYRDMSPEELKTQRPVEKMDERNTNGKLFDYMNTLHFKQEERIKEKENGPREGGENKGQPQNKEAEKEQAPQEKAEVAYDPLDRFMNNLNYTKQMNAAREGKENVKDVTRDSRSANKEKD